MTSLYSFESYAWYNHHLHLTYPLDLLPTAWVYGVGFFFKKKSAAFINLAWVIHPPYACHWPNVTVISSQTDWPDRVVVPWERRGTVSSPVQRSLRERQSTLVNAAAPSSPFFTAWSTASKIGKKKDFCSHSLPFPGSHSYDICLEMQGRWDTRPFLSVTGAAGIHNLLYKPEGNRCLPTRCAALRWGLRVV